MRSSKIGAREASVGSPRISAGTRTFSMAVSVGINWKVWKTKPMCRPRNEESASSSSSVMTVPSMLTLPRDGRSRPAMSPKSVDLPLPEGPVMAMNSCASIDRSTPSSTVRACLPSR
jgi:hypothetical protein